MSKSKTTAIAEKQTELQIIRAISEETDVPIADVKAIFSSLNGLLHRHMKKRGSGLFKIPKIGLKIKRVKKPATKARMGRNPATGEEMRIAAKPARLVIKATVLKALKEMVG